MIQGFEQYTAELTDNEREVIVPIVCAMLNGRKAENAITNIAIREALQKRGHRVSDPTIRKVINYIRLRGLVQRVVASAKGYYIAGSIREVEDYCRSLTQRSNSILAVKSALLEQINGKLF